MRTEEVTVHVLVGAVAIFIIAMMANTLMKSMEPLDAILWSAAVGCLLLGIGTFVRIAPKELRVYAFAGAALLFLIAIVSQNNLLPYCGDGVCGSNECVSCAQDCKPNDCENGKCEPPIERCDNSKDCGCFEQACAPKRMNASERGCSPIQCGDKYCDAPESWQSCCEDCGCPTGYNCERGVCFFEPPKITFLPYMLTKELSAASMMGNPTLTDENGMTHPLMGVSITTDSPAYGMTVEFSIPGIVNSTVPAGDLYSNTTVLWYLPAGISTIALNDTATNITMRIRYQDMIKDGHTITRQFPFTIRSRHTIDPYNNIVLFTQALRTTSTSPESIWDELREDMTLIQRPAHIVFFPYETIAAHQGSAQDMAALLSSAYETAGLRPSIVETEQGYLVRIRQNNRYVMIDPSLIEESFTDAIVSRPGYAVYDLAIERTRRNFTSIPHNTT
jgi:hypothetical protein